MEIFEILGKVIVLITSVILVYKHFSTIISFRKDTYIKNYEITEKLISNGKINDVHDFTIEQGYLALTGKKLEASLIRFFLALKDPQKKLILFHSGVNYLNVKRDELGNVLRVELNDDLNTKKKIKNKKIWIIIPYFIYAMLGMIPLFFGIKNIFLNIDNFILILIWSIPFISLAGLELSKGANLNNAIKLNEILNEVILNRKEIKEE